MNKIQETTILAKDFKGNFLVSKLPKNVANVLIDVNGIIHKAGQAVYHYGGKTDEEKLKTGGVEKVTVEKFDGDASGNFKMYNFIHHMTLKLIMKHILMVFMQPL